MIHINGLTSFTGNALTNTHRCAPIKFKASTVKLNFFNFAVRSSLSLVSPANNVRSSRKSNPAHTDGILNKKRQDKNPARRIEIHNPLINQKKLFKKVMPAYVYC